MLDADGKKKCPRCGESKVAVDHFYRASSRQGDGFHGYCKPCVKAKVIEWQKANPDKKAAQDRKQWLKPERQEANRQHNKKSRAKHRSRRDAEIAVWAKANPDKVRAKSRRWAKAHPEAIREFARLRHARVRASGGRLSRKEWDELKVKFAHACAYCGARDLKLTLEHLTPVSKGGKTVRGNIVPACVSCNSSKQAKDLEEFAGAESAQIIRQMAA